MTTIRLDGTGLLVSRLSFGTARLHHLATSARRQRLLSAAIDNGFTHFDTAPSYGFGLAEIELGRFLKANRNVTVATKIGIYPPNAGDPSTVSVWGRKLAGKLLPFSSRLRTDWSVGAALKGLEVSLRRLEADAVDLLLLHDPVHTRTQSDVLLAWLEAERDKGRIRGWGLAGEAARMQPWLRDRHPLGMVLQVRDSIDRREADLVTTHGRALQLTYGYLGSSASGRNTAAVSDVLERALARNSSGSVLVSTRHRAHLNQLARTAGEPHALAH